MHIKRIFICTAALVVMAWGLCPNLLHAQTSVTGTPIAHWRFENGDLTTDSTGNGNTLSNYGATWVADDYDGTGTTSNGSAYFNGTDSWMSTLNTLDLSSYEAIRVSGWVKSEPTAAIIWEHTADANAGPGGFYAYSESAGNVVNGVSYTGAAGLGFSSTGGVGNYDLLSCTPYVWDYQVVEIRPRETDPTKVVQTWTNGVLNPDDAIWGTGGLPEKPAGALIPFADDNFFIGMRSGNVAAFNGTIDDMKIEDLTGSSVIAHWEFNQGADFLKDSSGNGYDLLGSAASVTDDYDGSGLGSAQFDGTAGLETEDPLLLSSYTHLRVSWKMKVPDSSMGIVYELTPNCNENDGALVVATNSLADGMGEAQMCWDGINDGNNDKLPHSNDNTWSEYVIEYDLEAADPADTIIITVDGVVLDDSLNYPQKNSPANTFPSFLDDYMYLASRAGSGLYFGGNLDEMLIEAIPTEVPETPQIPGDANKDGKVDGSDVTILAGNWQKGVSDGQTAIWEDGDFNNDGKVDGSDVTILAGNWQTGVTAAAAAVPEPGTLVLLIGGLVCLLIKRRR